MTPQRVKYLSFMLGPFFRWWWALITGIATLLTYRLTPQPGWQLGPVGALVLTLTCSSLLFLVVSVVNRGWQLFRGRYSELVVRGIQKSKDFGSEWVFVVSAGIDLPSGTVIDVHRRLGDVEVPFALVEIVSATSAGHYQALPRWLAPAHIRDYTSGKFSLAETVVIRNITATRIRDFSGATT